MLKDLERELASVSVEREALERRHSALEKAVAGVRELISLNGGAVPALATERPAITRNQFADMGNLDASIKYLEMAGKPQTNREVLNALIAGGKTSKSKSFSDTLRVTLLREAEKPDGRLTWKPPHWSLRSWDEK
jgi:hypothetical protein